jgi:hypothetical protein
MHCGFSEFSMDGESGENAPWFNVPFIAECNMTKFWEAADVKAAHCAWVRFKSAL